MGDETEDQIWQCYNGLLLSCDIDRIRKLLVRYDLFRMTLHVPGDIVECGVFKGAGMIYWRKLLEIYTNALPKRVIGFDTFSSYADSCQDFEVKEKDQFVNEAGFQGTDVEQLKDFFHSCGLGDKSEFIKGDLKDSAPEYVRENPGFRISLLNLDLDTYAGTKEALSAFYPLVSRHGVIVFDEYGKRGWGESDAVDEFFRDMRDVNIIAVPNSVSPTAYIIKP